MLADIQRARFTLDFVASKVFSKKDGGPCIAIGGAVFSGSIMTMVSNRDWCCLLLRNQTNLPIMLFAKGQSVGSYHACGRLCDDSRVGSLLIIPVLLIDPYLQR